MPSEMTPEELETARTSATAVDSYDYRNDDDEDDYFSASLYETTDGRRFRVVESSGMNSQFEGAGDIAEWLTDEEAKSWNEF